MTELPNFRKLGPSGTRNRAGLAFVLVAAALGAMTLIQPDKPSVGGDLRSSALDASNAPSNCFAACTLSATGIVQSVNQAKRTFVLDLGISQSMGWPVLAEAGFVVHDAQLMEGLAIGSKVTISYRRNGPNNQVTAIETTPAHCSTC